MTKTRIVLVDDHDIVRIGVRDLLASCSEFDVVGEAGEARDAFPIIASTRPDIVLMDIFLPGMDGVVATREVLRRTPRISVVILTAHAQVSDVLDAQNAGARGYVLKADAPERLLQALGDVSRGGRYISPTVAARLPPLAAALTRSVLDDLSEREREIFRLAADCRTSPEIAKVLCLARKTVDTHLNHINSKLGLHDRAGLVRLAVHLGLVHSIRTPDLCRESACERRAGTPAAHGEPEWHHAAEHSSDTAEAMGHA